MASPRLKDWTDLETCERRDAFARCVQLAERLQSKVSPFTELCATPAQKHGGVLQGLPYAAKDMLQCPGREPSWGLAHPVGGLANDVKADVLTQLDEAGARCVGFTRMTALAYEPSGVNPLQGAPINPWNASHAPGASSSGSAVAVATGAAFVALGSDTGGSLRIPAQGCGVTAWKPTHGCISGAGAMSLAPSLDAIGLLARSAQDIIETLPVFLNKVGAVTSDQHPQKIAILKDAIKASHRAVQSVCENALEVLRSSTMTFQSGKGLQTIDEAGNEALVVMQAEAARTHRGQLEAAVFDPVLTRRLSTGFDINDEELAASLARRGIHLDATLERVFAGADMLLLPVMPIRTPLLEETEPTSPQFSARALYALSNFTRFVNYLGLPAVAFPAGFDDRSLPVAIQLVGRPGADAQLLSAAAAFQTQTDWHGRLPTTLLDLEPHYGDLLA